MKDDYQLRKFTEKDLDDFEKIRKEVESNTSAKDRLAVLLHVQFDFNNYLIEKLYKKSQLNDMTGKKNKPNTDIQLYPKKLDEIYEHLEPKDRKFHLNLINLKEYIISTIDLSKTYPDIDIKNRNDYLLEEHSNSKENITNERMIWLSNRESCELLISELKINEFIDDIDTNIAISIFCDKYGNVFSSRHKTMLKWCKLMTEFTFMIKMLTDHKYNLVSDKNIWIKCSKCFLDKNGKSFNHKRLSVSYQKGNPKTKSLITSILDKVSKSSETLNS